MHYITDSNHGNVLSSCSTRALTVTVPTSATVTTNSVALNKHIIADKIHIQKPHAEELSPLFVRCFSSFREERQINLSPTNLICVPVIIKSGMLKIPPMTFRKWVEYRQSHILYVTVPSHYTCFPHLICSVFGVTSFRVDIFDLRRS